MGSSVSTTVEVGPPKYQVVIPNQVRKALEIEGERVILEGKFEVKKVLEEGES